MGGNAKVERLEEFTQYLNQNVLQGRMIFKLKHDEREIAFLDTTVRLINGYLVTEIYSRPTDAHQYLHASTSHPKHIMKGIPFSVGSRIRRNCSDRVQGDQYFTDNLVECEIHLLKCGYASENRDRKFLKAATIKREKTVAPKEQKLLNTSSREYYFVTDYDPEFPNIRMYLEKHQHILVEDPECRVLFPKGSLKVTRPEGTKFLRNYWHHLGLREKGRKLGRGRHLSQKAAINVANVEQIIKGEKEPVEWLTVGY